MSIQEPWHIGVPDGFDTPEHMTAIPMQTPKNDLAVVPSRLIDASRPVYGWGDVSAGENNLLKRDTFVSDPLGQRILIHGRETDGWWRPVKNLLLEIWQANSAQNTSTSTVQRCHSIPTSNATEASDR